MGWYLSQEGRKELGTPEFDATMCIDLVLSCLAQTWGFWGRQSSQLSCWGGTRADIHAGTLRLMKKAPQKPWQPRSFCSSLGRVSTHLDLSYCWCLSVVLFSFLFFFLFFLFGLFTGTWPGHVQTQTIQQCWRVDSIYLNDGSLFSILFNPQLRWRV